MVLGITGANSFIGREIIRQSIRKGWKCICFVRNENSICDLKQYNEEKIDIHEVSPDDYKCIGKNKMDCLVNLAWDGTRGISRMDFHRQRFSFKLNMDAIISALEYGCKVIVTAGSQAEYGAYDRPITEQDMLKPNTEYGRYKAELYYRASELTSNFHSRFLEPRYFSLYGPGDSPDTMIERMITRMVSGEACELTECIQMWDYLYLEDAVRGLLNLVEKDGANGAYNFGSGDCRPLKDYVLEMKRVIRSRSELLFGKIPYPATGMVSIQPDVQKLMRDADWKPEIPFAEGIKKIYEEKKHGRF